MTKKKLTLRGVHKTIAGKKILSNINFSIENNEIVGLLGPNGAGKTTAFYIAAGLLFPDQGKVSMDGREITNFLMHQRSRVGLSYLPQEPSIFQDLTVFDNLDGIAEITTNNQSERNDVVEMIVSKFDLRKIIDKKGRMLSGGQRRKVEIARTLVSNPRVILLDEPFAGIDPIAVEEIKSLLRKVVSNDISILITDHNVRETLSLCNRAIIMNEGEIIAEGTSNELIEDALVKKTYFGNMYSS
jgi:lipopolysaccharide export system ATP-binding protein